MEKLVPEVSILIRTHQRPQFLVQALQSLSQQDFRDFEVLIIEDGPPISKSLIKHFENLNINYICTEYPVGRAKAANIGLKNATGKFINFLDDDDLLLPHHISSMVDALKKNDDVDVVHMASIERKITIKSNYPLSVITLGERTKYNKPLDHQKIFFENCFPIQAAMFKRSLYEKYGGIDENLELLEDWDLWIKYSMHAKFKYIDSITSIYHVPGDKTTLKKRRKLLRNYEFNIKNKYAGYIKDRKYKPVCKVRKLIDKLT